MCLNDANQQTTSSALKKLSGSQKLQITYWNEKLDTMLSQVNAPQNSRQMIDNIHNDFQPLACIMTERFDNTPKDQSNYYLREENKNECREETTQNKADKLLTSLQRDNQSRRQAKKIKLSWNLTFTSYYVIDKQQIHK